MPPTVAACGRTHEEARARAERRAAALGLKEFKVQTHLFSKHKPPILATLPAAEREALRKKEGEMKTEQGRDPAAAKAEYESLRSEIERLDARRKEVADELRGCVDSGCAPDGVKLIPVTKIAITDPYALCEAIGDDIGDLELLEAIIRGAVTINAAKAATLIEKAGLPEDGQARLAAFFDHDFGKA